ncbi:MAG: histidine phosphatase family protein [Xanthomonadales bacterium]|nr:histidine phosphatase family protein [Xanthomonadales bacterium]
MHIGLVRHFPVTEAMPRGWLSSDDLHHWPFRYDAAEPVVGEFDLGGVRWQACLCSDQPRAIATAVRIHGEGVEHTPLLREARFERFRTGGLRLPFGAWKWRLRLSWMSGHASQRHCRDDFRHRVGTVADRLVAMDRDVLVVSHAGMIACLATALRRRGFVGPVVRAARHAHTCVYRKARICTPVGGVAEADGWETPS